MKILLLTASLPYPPHQGGAIRTYGLLTGLKQEGHAITLMSFHEANGVSAGYKDTPLNNLCERIETIALPQRRSSDRLRDLLFTGDPDIARRLYSQAFWERLRQLVTTEQFDLVQAEGIEVACYLPLLRAFKPDLKLCYDAFNAEAALQQVIFEVDRDSVSRWPAALYSWIQSRRIARFEHELCQTADLVIAVSNEDAQALQRYHREKPIPVVANGIFTKDYTSSTEALDLGQNALVFTGKMDYRPNVDAVFWFAEEVLPLLQRQIPDVKFVIVGQKPHARLEQLRDNPHIEITGWVKDVQPYLRGASLYVAPLRMGSGTRLKILEALATGKAVVATRIAASGMRADADQVMRIADEPSAMAASIVQLLEQPAERAALGLAAQGYVQQHYDWSVLIPRLLGAYKSVGLG